VPSAERPNPARLRVLVYDQDLADLDERAALLQRRFPYSSVDAYNSRRELLADIAGLPVHVPGERWPLALIDLVHDGLTAPGVHLVQTINEHPALNDRVAIVAFTRYGHTQRDELLHASGARAVLSPEELLNPSGGLLALTSALELIAKGSTNWIRIGDPPSAADDLALLARMTELFPELEEHVIGSREQWDRVREILLVCKLFDAGYTQKAVEDQLETTRAAIDKLRRQLQSNPKALSAGVVKIGSTSVDLGRIPAGLEPFLGRSRAIWELVPPREELDGAGRLRWLAGLVADLYPADLDEPAPALPPDREAWVPPEYVPWLRRFFGTCMLLRENKHDNPKADVDRAINVVAAMFDVPRERARHGIVHAVLCLEDSESDGPAAGSVLKGR
jgi:CheY-like chemotaxis protein